MTADDTITRAAEVIERHLPAMHDQQSARLSVDMAQALADAGLLVTPEHDAEVAAQALREAASEVAYAVDWEDAPESVESWLYDRADRI